MDFRGLCVRWAVMSFMANNGQRNNLLERGDFMRFSYNPLWKLLIDRGLNKSDLRAMSNISSATIAKLNKGENITTDILLRICEGLKCDITDIMEIVDN